MINLKRLCQAWNSFWFQPESPVPLAIFRILFGALVLQFGWFMSAELHTMLGEKALVSQAANDAWNATPRINVLALLPHGDSALDLFWIVFMIAAACLTLGLCTRLSAVIVYLALVSCDARNSFIFTGADNMLRVEAFLLVFSQCGAALSFDRLLAVWLARKPEYGHPAPRSPWALRLIQVQTALCYWAAYSSKINGWTWIDGTAIYYVTHIVEENKFAFPYLYDHLWTCKILSWLTLFAEFSLAVLIWVKELRLPIILLAIPFHLCLDYTLIIPQFQFVMIASLIGFIEPSTWRLAAAAARARARQIAGAPLFAVYDGALDLSLRLAETIRRLDLLRLVNLVDVRDAGAELTDEQRSAVLDRPGILVFRWTDRSDFISGAGALTRIFLRLPLTVLFSPLFYLPGCGSLVAAAAALLKRLYPGQLSNPPATPA